MYRLIFLLFSFLLYSNFASSQRFHNHEAGIFLGTSYYMGDINPANQFYDPLPAFGVLVKRYLNERHCLRVSGTYGQFRGSDSDFSNAYQRFRNASFRASMLDANLCYEFNFMPFRYDPRKISFSPYIFFGLGYEFMLQTESSLRNHFVIPFGVGAKYALSKKVTFGAEWSFRKTFADTIDGVENPGESGDKSLTNNKDWYSYAGFFITFRLFDPYANCPAFQ